MAAYGKSLLDYFSAAFQIKSPPLAKGIRTTVLSIGTPTRHFSSQSKHFSGMYCLFSGGEEGRLREGGAGGAF